MQRDLEIDLLRGFLAVAASRNFTRAAADLGRTQSAVSLQIRRLEEIVGQSLFDRSPQSVTLTPAGETLLVHAGRILRANDEALAQMWRPDAAGLVRLGAPDDYAACLLPPVLNDFASRHPLIRLEVASGNSADLLQLLDRGELDLVLATHPAHASGGRPLRHERLHWVASPTFSDDPAAALPLVLFPPGCVCRTAALEALESIDRPWHVAWSTRSHALIESAVRAGSGVAVMEKSTIPESLRILDGQAGLPALPDVVIALHRRPGEGAPAVALAADFLATAL